MKRVIPISILLVFFSGSLFAAESTPSKGTQGKPAIQVVESEIDLGLIADDVEEIVGNIYIHNDGEGVLWINKVSGACVCYAGHTGDRSIKPKEVGEIQVKFIKSKIPAGKVTRKITINTNDPVNNIVEVILKFEVKRSGVEEEIFKLNTEVASLHKELKIVRRDLRQILWEVMKIKDPNATLADAYAHRKRPPDMTIYDVAVGDSPTFGPDDAPVTIVEFSSFQCSWCVREYPKLEQLVRDYKGKVRLVFKHCPLEKQEEARPAHAATELAKREKGVEAFWKMHDMIFSNTNDLGISTLRGYAEQLGMDLAKFDEVMADPAKIEALIEPDLLEARKTKVTGTPTILINGLKLSGKRTIASYKQRIDQLLTVKGT